MRHFVMLLGAATLSLGLGGMLTPAISTETSTTIVDWQETPMRLLMVTRRGCIYCEKWDAEIGEGYNASSEGQRAPLLKIDLNGVWPDGIVLESRPYITPTFIILIDGKEVSRLEGYPGEHHFYPVLDQMLHDLDQGGKVDDNVES